MSPGDDPRRAESDVPWSDDVHAMSQAVLESAARLQVLVPDAVLVGGMAAALRAGHRLSYDHDHVVAELKPRFDIVLGALEDEGDWVTNRVTPGKIILGKLGDIEAGVRQMIRAAPLESEQVRLPSGRTLTVPTLDETLRVKAFLIVRRNQTRDYLDVAALADKAGLDRATEVLTHIDDYYTDPDRDDRPVLSQLIRQFAVPRPKDSRTLGRLTDYKGLDERWTDWDAVRTVCRDIAERLVLGQAEGGRG